jgi:hypothetical protein
MMPINADEGSVRHLGTQMYSQFYNVFSWNMKEPHSIGEPSFEN